MKYEMPESSPSTTSTSYYKGKIQFTGSRKIINYEVDIDRRVYSYYRMFGVNHPFYSTVKHIQKLTNIANEIRAELTITPRDYGIKLPNNDYEYNETFYAQFKSFIYLLHSMQVIMYNYPQIMIELTRSPKKREAYKDFSVALRVLYDRVNENYTWSTMRMVVEVAVRTFSYVRKSIVFNEMTKETIEMMNSAEEVLNFDAKSLPTTEEMISFIDQLLTIQNRIAGMPGAISNSLQKRLQDKISQLRRIRYETVEDLPENLRERIQESLSVTNCKFKGAEIDLARGDKWRLSIYFNHPRFNKVRHVLSTLDLSAFKFDFCVDSENHTLTNALLVHLTNAGSNMNLL